MAATSVPLHELADALIGDLVDRDQGCGFVWWEPGPDWRRRALIADYAIQSARGAADSLTLASLCAQDFGELRYANTYKTLVAFQGADRDVDPLVALPRSKEDRRRVNRIDSALEGCFFNLGRAFDRVAAVMIVLGGIRTRNLIRVDWMDIDQLLESPLPAKTADRLNSPGTPGRIIQDAMLRPAARTDELGPQDWFAWMRGTRNTLTHRAPAVRMQWATMNDQGRPDGFWQGLLAEPSQSEIQALVSTTTKEQFGRVKSDSERVLNGLVGSSARLLRRLTEQLAGARSSRRADPAIIAVDPAIWKDLAPSRTLAFPGYGPEPRLMSGPGTQIHLAPGDGRRWVAAGVMDDTRTAWLSDDSN